MKLDLGNSVKREGWVTVDIYGHPDIRHDLRVFPYPFDDDSADEILLSHVLEHLDRENGRRMLAECWRILSPDGRIHIAVPDMDKFIDCKSAADGCDGVNAYGWRSLDTLLGGDDTERVPEMRHKYMYCFASLAYTLLETGYDFITRRGALLVDNPQYADISLYVDAMK